MTCAQYNSPAPMCACGNEITKFFKSGKPGKFCAACRDKQTGALSKAVKRECCAQCGATELPLTTAGKKAKYCSASCKWRAQTLRRNPDSGTRRTNVDRTCTCNGCGKQYENKRRRTDGEGSSYCSRECAFENIEKWRTGVPIGYKRRPDNPGPTCNVFFKSCPACARSFATRWEKKETCSAECAHAWNLRRLRDEYEPAQQRVCRCRTCGDEFKTCRAGKFCSSKCADRAADKGNHRKRARRFGVAYEPVNRLRVFARDGWRCQICGKKTPQKRLGTMSTNAPELDHRVPLSKGGGHLYSNVQCACRQCNGDKGNKSSVGQLPMFPA